MCSLHVLHVICFEVNGICAYFCNFLQYFQGNIAAAAAVYRKALERAAEKQNLDALSTLYVHFARLDYLVANMPSPQ